MTSSNPTPTSPDKGVFAPAIETAMRLSRSTRPLNSEIPRIMEAERLIGAMDDSSHAVLLNRMSREPANGFLRLWNGLVLMARGKAPEACQEFLSAGEMGCNNWRIGWYLAQAARDAGDLECVDAACAAVLKANPEFWFARELPKHARGYYSQCGQDEMIERFFQQHPPRTKRFVEVGAFDGVHYSNVRRLHEKAGWSGLSIEPVGKNYRKLAASYQGTSVKCVQAAVSTQEGELSMNVSTYPHLPDWGSDVATFCEGEKERWTREYGAVWTTETVPARSLTHLVEEAGLADFDLLSIDTEGHDLEVLKSLDFDRYNPQLIVVEYGGQREEILRLLSKQGYSLIQDNAQDLIVARTPVQDLSRQAANVPAKSLEALHKRLAALNQCKTRYPDGNTFGMDRLYQGFDRIQVKGQRSTEFRKKIYRLDQYLKPTDRLLDIGCNCGFMAMSVADSVREVVGFDADSAVIEIANEVKNFLGLNNCTFLNQSFDQFDKSGCYDVVCSYAVHHWIGLPFAEYARILWNLLNPEGRLIFESHDLRTTDKDLAVKLQALRQIGFVMISDGRYQETPDEYDRLFYIFQKPAQVSATLPSTAILPCGNHDRWEERINPHLFTIIPRERFQQQRVAALSELITPHRIDVIAKLIYARHRELGVQSRWALDLYAAHLQAFNGCREGDRSGKDSLAKFIDSFHETLDSIKAKGFDAGQTLLPASLDGVIIDGGHRAAACLLHQAAPTFIEVDFKPASFNAEYFRQRGLAEKYLNAMAIEFARSSTQSRLVIVLASERASLEAALAEVQSRTTVCHERQFVISARGVVNLHRQFEDAVQPAIAGKASYALAILFIPQKQENGAEHVLSHLPQTVRGYVANTIEQTVDLAELVFNDNGLDFLNTALPAALPKFKQRLDALANWLCAKQIPAASICLHDATVLAAYGIADTETLTILHHGICFDESLPTGLVPDNSSIHGTHPDEIIYDPRNHFCYGGFKFAALHVVRKLKAARNSGRDHADVEALDRFLGAAPPLPSGLPLTFTNNWFGTHEPHWNEKLTAWAAGRSDMNILEIGSYEGRSTCWFLLNIMQDRNARLTCVDPWSQQSSARVYDDNMEEVFKTFQDNIRITGKSDQVVVLRQNSSDALARLPDASFDLIYVDGDHGTERVFADSKEAFRLVKPGGMILWDDYYWFPSVTEGIDHACAELGIQIARFGNNASYQKAFGPAPQIGKTKIVALVPARNESPRLPFCLRAIAHYADAIVYLDDCSDDDSVAVVQSLATECRIEKIITKPQWHRDEPGDRNALLKAGREIGGTHFLVLDADEAFTANCTRDAYLRRLVLSLRPGERLVMTWIQLWRNVRQYRFDDSPWTYDTKAFAFCDDGQCSYESGFIHTPRVPENLTGRSVSVAGYIHGVLHFQFVNWRNLQIKQVWYRCMERLRCPERSAAEINAQYAPSEDETGLRTRETPDDWIGGYDFFDPKILETTDLRRVNEMLQWFRDYGVSYFAGLDIWRMDWGFAEQLDPAVAVEIARAKATPTSPAENISPPSSPTVKYGNGVHKDENGFRWLDEVAEIKAVVPQESYGALISFILRVGKMEWYPSTPVRSVVMAGGQVIREIQFTGDFQAETVEVELPPGAETALVRIESSPCFGGDANDPRHLTVQLRQCIIKPSAKPVVSLDFDARKTRPVAAPVAAVEPSVSEAQAEHEYRQVEVAQSFDVERARKALDVFSQWPETVEYNRNHLNRYLATMERVRHLPRSTRVLEVGAAPFGMTVLMREFLFDFVQPTGFAENDAKRAQQVYSEKLVIGKPQEGHGYEFDLQCFNIEKHKWPFDDASFDLVISCEVFEHLALDPMFAMAEINRVTRPGGTLLISVPNVLCVSNLYKMLDGRSPNSFPVYRPRGECLRHNRELTPTELATMFQAAGFEPTTVETSTFNPPPHVPPAMLAKIHELTGGFQWRHEVLTVVGRKTGPVVNRYPLEAELYYEWDVKANRV